MLFLGLHDTPGIDATVSLGPTAIPVWGRENCRGLEGLESLIALKFLGVLSSQCWMNASKFRRYANKQALHGLKPLFLKAAQGSSLG